MSPSYVVRSWDCLKFVQMHSVTIVNVFLQYLVRSSLVPRPEIEEREMRENSDDDPLEDVQSKVKVEIHIGFVFISGGACVDFLMFI